MRADATDGRGTTPAWTPLVKAWLRDQDRSQAWLAKRARVNAMHLSNVLLGKSQVGIPVLARLEDAMGMKPGDLLLLARNSAILHHDEKK